VTDFVDDWSAARIFVIAAISTTHTAGCRSRAQAGGLPVPSLGLTIVPPQGVADPQVTESYGGARLLERHAGVGVWPVRSSTRSGPRSAESWTT